MSWVDEHRLRQEIPTWRVNVMTAGLVSVRSPTFELDGMVIQGRDAEEVIERVRNVERIWALALHVERGRAASSRPVALPSAGVEAVSSKPAPAMVLVNPRRQKRRAKPAPSTSYDQGFSGNVCDVCGSDRVKRTSAACETCLDCGSSTGCG